MHWASKYYPSVDLAGFSLVPSYVLAGIHVTRMMFIVCSTILPITGVKYFLKRAFNSVNSSSTLALLHKSINRNVVISIFRTHSQGAKVEFIVAQFFNGIKQMIVESKAKRNLVKKEKKIKWLKTFIDTFQY